jgi:hypothetical integral membrane protein (TIGR02206 family)
MPTAFQPYGFSHKVVLVITLVLFILMQLLARTRWALLSQRLLGGALLGLYPVSFAVNAYFGWLNVQTSLPLQYCDIATLAAGMALWTRRPFYCEVVYFFGIAGTLQGLLTPALIYEFPDPRFFMFFVIHSGVPITAFYVVTAMKIRPRPWAVPRVMLFSLAWYAVVAVVNLSLGANYAFQCAKPVHASLFDKLGPRPWYNLSTIIVGLLFYTLLYLPFFRRNRIFSSAQPLPPSA